LQKPTGISLIRIRVHGLSTSTCVHLRKSSNVWHRDVTWELVVGSPGQLICRVLAGYRLVKTRAAAYTDDSASYKRQKVNLHLDFD
jgi:hypothetical protein